MQKHAIYIAFVTQREIKDNYFIYLFIFILLLFKFFNFLQSSNQIGCSYLSVTSNLIGSWVYTWTWADQSFNLIWYLITT